GPPPPLPRCGAEYPRVSLLGSLPGAEHPRLGGRAHARGLSLPQEARCRRIGHVGRVLLPRSRCQGPGHPGPDQGLRPQSSPAHHCQEVTIMAPEERIEREGGTIEGHRPASLAAAGLTIVEPDPEEEPEEEFEDEDETRSVLITGACGNVGAKLR